MTQTVLTKLSSRGQIVIPMNIRNQLGLKDGETFAITGKHDTLILKKIKTPSSKELFEDIHAWGVSFAKKRNLREKYLQELIKKGRQL
ncbi:AbrB/MazE/SpoVT family DNA-binding domain-containing protein [Candidatus Woesearchaeota archaeon]|nr:AbrB/MazE/SpoVT family DNA-binding domain-containing protein [Candidatus Woesearchaeota archaeon]